VNNNNNNKKVIKAAMFGSLVGAVMGLLLAPKSGQELRQDLVGQAQKVETKAIVMKAQAQSAWQNVENKTKVTINNGKSWIQKGKRLVSNLKRMVSEIQQGALTTASSIDTSEKINSEDLTKEI